MATGPGGRAPVLEVRDLSKSFGTAAANVEVLSHLALEVQPGELVSIVGPSGAGKTTLLRCLSGLARPTSGAVYLHGDEVIEPPDDLAVVFQDYSRSLMPWLRVLTNVTLPLRRRGLARAERNALGTEMLHAVGLDGAERKYPWQLSGGMQQRVAIARALAYRPQVLLMDEPFASLDAQTRADLEDLLRRIQMAYGLAVVFVTHDIDEAVYLSDHVVVLGGTPTSVVETLAVDLPAQRDQVATKSLPRFAELRSHVLSLIQTTRHAGAASSATDHGDA